MRDRARRDGVEAAAFGAFDNGLDCGGHRLRERYHELVALLEEGQRRLASRARAQPGQLRKQLDEPFDLGTGDLLQPTPVKRMLSAT
jgi:hypothetical protein